MANPQILGPDGALRTNVIFSTNITTRFFEGTLPEDAVEVQVSINGSGYSSDDALVQWGDGTWVVPNPTYEPDGLVLSSGVNTISLRTIIPSGAVTTPTSATVRVVSPSSLGLIATAPTNISVIQQNQAVLVRAESVGGNGFQGMNFYASQFAGGGVSGYTRINVNRVSDVVLSQEVEEFASQTVDIPVAVDGDDTPLADPMLFRVQGSQEDEDGVVLQADFNETYEVPETARTIQMNLTLNQVRDVAYYQFLHNRLAGPTSSPATVRVASFVNLPPDQPLYYVVTAVFYDSTSNVEYESTYSTEVVAHPEQVTTAIGAIPTVSRQSIVKEYITAIFRSNPQIKVEAGSVLRDTVIDPFAAEAERLRFVLDFYHRARTPTLLLQVDDPTGSGVSVPVSQSAYKRGLKQALYISSDTDVQDLIDSAFDAYASNLGVQRRSGTSAAGEVLFYTNRATSSILIPLGTLVSAGSVQFATTREINISNSNIASYYNPINGSFQVAVPVRATSTGARTNVGVGQVRTVISSLPVTLQVTNLAAIRGGLDAESNLALMVRTHNRLASVDTGTARGYLQTAADVPGVVKANVIAAGDPLMQRDLNTAGEHKGGKVDIWVQGENVTTVTDTFAFTYEIAQDVQFEVLNVDTLTFRALDNTLSEANPIVQVLDAPTAGYEFQNISTGEAFDLTDVEILTYDTIRLSTDVVQPSVALTNIILGSYRTRASRGFTLPRQPVSEVTSVIGTVSGTLPENAYLLIHPEDPLNTGRSRLAGDYLDVVGYTDTTGQIVPSGTLINVEDEEHVLVGQYPEFLDRLGANYLSLVVTNQEKTVTYAGPDDPSGLPDYQVSLGSQTTALSITRTESSTIPNGATVLVSYEHDENFTVTYKTNLIVSLTQQAVDESKHATADVLVKEAVPVPVDIEATILLVRGRDAGVVDTALRTNMANFFSNLRLGSPVRQSDIINVIEETDGVSYVIVPLTRMVRQEGSLVVRESLSTDTAAESTLIQSLSTNEAAVYLLDQALSAATTNGGGVEGEFKGVFQDDQELDLLAGSASLTSLGVASGRAYIIGSEGAVLDGYSDDTTLEAEGYMTTTAKSQRRVDITANRVLVSYTPGTGSPTDYSYTVTYVVGVDMGAKNIEPGGAEYCTTGNLVFTYDEDR